MVQHLKKKAAMLLVLLISFSWLYIFSGIFAEHTVSAQTPSDPKANQTAVNIINYLNELSYSGRCVLGAFDEINKVNTNISDYYKAVSEKYGVTPSMYSTFYPYSRSNLAFETEETFNRIAEHYNAGAICMVHFQNSWGKYCMDDFSEVSSVDFLVNFDATNKERNMDVYERYMLHQKQWADALEELQNAGITVIYRPFVEMTNHYHPECYAQSKEGKEAFKRIWQQHYDYMVNERGLHNLVWCYAPQASGGAEDALSYYPGNDYVDVIGVTLYAGGATGENSMENLLSKWSFDGFFKLGKAFGFSEIGVHEADNEAGDWSHMLAGVRDILPSVTFCNVWSALQGLLTDTNINSDKFVKDSFFVSLSELPDYQNGVYSKSGVAAAFANSNYGGDIQILPEGSYNAAQLEASGIDVSKIVSVRIDSGYAIEFYTGDNFKGKSYTLISDTKNISSIGITASQIKSMKVKTVKIENTTLKKPVLCSDPNSNYEYLNDGTIEFWETYEGNPCWAIIDLQDVYLLNSWEVQNISSYGEDHLSNASDYRLQYSLDGKQWKDADVVFGNTSSVTSQEIQQVKAQYVRLYVENPNRSNFEMDRNRCAVCEFTVYGMKISSGIDTDWTLLDLSQSAVSSQISSASKPTDSGTDNSDLSNSNDETEKNSEEEPEKTEKEPSFETEDGNLIWIFPVIGALLIIIAGIVVFIIVKRKKQ